MKELIEALDTAGLIDDDQRRLLENRVPRFRRELQLELMTELAFLVHAFRQGWISLAKADNTVGGLVTIATVSGGLDAWHKDREGDRYVPAERYPY